jgi:mRNA-degrading endonuclease toxin of MazEF toxin-antitoxin module
MVNNQKGKIMVDQIRSFDKENRLVKKLGTLPVEVLQQAEQLLNKLTSYESAKFKK